MAVSFRKKKTMAPYMQSSICLDLTNSVPVVGIHFTFRPSGRAWCLGMRRSAAAAGFIGRWGGGPQQLAAWLAGWVRNFREAIRHPVIH